MPKKGIGLSRKVQTFETSLFCIKLILYKLNLIFTQEKQSRICA